MAPKCFVSVGKYSVMSDVPEVLDAIGHSYEPTPGGIPVLVVSGDDPTRSGVPSGTIVYSYPDHAGDLASLLGKDIPGQPDGSSNGMPAGSAFFPITPMVPESVTATQIRLWLFRHGITGSMVEASLAAIPDEQTRGEAQIQWEYAPYVERLHPLVTAIGESLGLTSEQVDDAFREASTL
jgi:hypothetical protein